MRRLLSAVCGVALATAATITALSSPASAAASSTPAAQPASPVTYAAATAASGGGQPQAINPDSLSQCGAHTLCLWDYRGFSGTFWHFTLNNPYAYDTWYYVGSSANDKATSVYNSRGYCTLLSKNFPPTSPDIVEIGGGISIYYLGNYAWPDGTSMNNSISGFALLSGC